MKSFGTFAVCAFMYILVIILLQVCEAYIVSENIQSKRDVSSVGADKSQIPFGSDGSQIENGKSNINSTGPFDFLQITDPTAKNVLKAAYGAMQGNTDCTKKTLCIAGNYLQQIPGKDFIFIFLGRYVPTDFSLLYDIFRISVMYGQNCEAYLCSPAKPAA